MKVGVRGLVAAAAVMAVGGAPARADAPDQMAAAKAAGGAIFKARCSTCHDAPGSKAPSRAQIGELSIEDIAKDLLLGPMAPQAHGLSVQQVGAVAVYVSHKATRPEPDAAANMCKAVLPFAMRGNNWNGWANDYGNGRFQPRPGFDAAHVGDLKLKWAFSYTGSLVYGQPTIVGARVFVTSVTGRVQALDAHTGCTIWTYEAGSGTRTAITVAPAIVGGAVRPVAYFGDEAAYAHAVDAATGKLLWKVKVDNHPAARVTGAPVWVAGRIIVPVASTEEVGATPPYSCCTFRGNVVALDGATGKQIWKTYTIEQAPKVYGKAKDGTPLMGPAGASVWSAPTVDTKLSRIYVGTSNSYTGVPTGASDAIIALDAKDGKQVWTNQVQAGDNFLVGCYIVKPPVCSFGICNGPGEGECPQKVGPDYDFGASPILRQLPNGRRMLVAGAKSGWVYGLDPDNGGKLVWKQKVGAGSPAGGIEWGMAADQAAVYAPTSDIYTGAPDKVGGLTALDTATGKVLWHAGPHAKCDWGAENCWGAMSQAVTVMPGVVFAGGLDGHLLGYDSKTGRVLWDTDTGGTFSTVNQGTQSGGSLNGGGPTAAGGMLFVNSGYGRFAGQNGHVLLAYGMP